MPSVSLVSFSSMSFNHDFWSPCFSTYSLNFLLLQERWLGLELGVEKKNLSELDNITQCFNNVSLTSKTVSQRRQHREEESRSRGPGGT